MPSAKTPLDYSSVTDIETARGAAQAAMTRARLCCVSPPRAFAMPPHRGQEQNPWRDFPISALGPHAGQYWGSLAFQIVLTAGYWTITSWPFHIPSHISCKALITADILCAHMQKHNPTLPPSICPQDQQLNSVTSVLAQLHTPGGHPRAQRGGMSSPRLKSPHR